MMRSSLAWSLCLLASIALAPLLASSRAFAQPETLAGADSQAQTQLDPKLKPASRRFESPERFSVELRGGPYTPAIVDKSYGRFFGGDIGPNLGVQVDGIVYRKPKIFYLTVGGSVGTLSFSGAAVQAATGTPTSEQTTLSIVPLMATVGIRLDVLPRMLKIPLILGARVGWEWAYWDTNTGSRNDAAGWSVGPVISGQVAIDLDSFEPAGARSLDEEWGINHTYIFGEVFHFATTGKSLELGATSWLLGLGLVF